MERLAGHDADVADLVATLLPQTHNDFAHGQSPINELGKKLLVAARDGRYDDVRDLLANGAPFAADWLGTSPLHLAAQHNHLEICDVLLRAGMCKDTRTKVERTPLHLAAYEGHLAVVECLLKSGAYVDVKDMLQMTPLHWAVQMGHAEVAATLIRHGAAVHVANKFDLTPTDIARQLDRPDMLEVISCTMRDPLQATIQLMEMNESDPVEDDLLPLSYVEPAAEHPQENFSASMKLLQQHGITMLPDDDDESSTILSSVMATGHSVVLTEAGRRALSSTRVAPPPPPPTPPPPPKRKKIITVTADQFLAMTSNGGGALRIVNGKLVAATAPAPKAKPPPPTPTTLEAHQLAEQLGKARALADHYKKRLAKTELELQKYKRRCKYLTNEHNLSARAAAANVKHGQVI